MNKKFIIEAIISKKDNLNLKRHEINYFHPHLSYLKETLKLKKIDCKFH